MMNCLSLCFLLTFEPLFSVAFEQKLIKVWMIAPLGVREAVLLRHFLRFFKLLDVLLGALGFYFDGFHLVWCQVDVRYSLNGDLF